MWVEFVQGEQGVSHEQSDCCHASWGGNWGNKDLLILLWGTGWDLLRSGVFRSQELGEGLKNRYGRYLTDEITRTHQVRMTPRLLWFIGSLKAWGLVWKWIPIQNIIGLVMGSLSQWPGNNGLFPDIQTHLGHSFAASYSRKQLIPVQIRGPTEHQTDTCTHVLKDKQF